MLWCRYGLQAPPIITTATDDYFESENMLLTWVVERCERGDRDLTSYTQDLYKDYASWAKTCNEYVLSYASLFRMPRNVA